MSEVPLYLESDFTPDPDRENAFTPDADWERIRWTPEP